MRRAWKLAAVLALIAAVGAWAALRSENRVTIGTTLSRGTSNAKLRLDEPFRAMLILGRPLAAGGRAHVEIRRTGADGEHVERMYTARAGTGNEELFIAFPHTRSVIEGPGKFRVVFVLEDVELGAAAMEVVP